MLWCWRFVFHNWGFLPIELFSCEFSVFPTMDIEGGGEWWWWGEVEVMVMLKAWAEGVGEVFILHSLSSEIFKCDLWILS